MYSNLSVKHINKELRNNKAIARCARQCGVIGDETKLKICYLLKHHPELNVSQIAQLVGASVSNVSHGLARLKDVNLVSVSRRGRRSFYSLNHWEFNRLVKTLGA